jgi:hypothetical protein
MCLALILRLTLRRLPAHSGASATPMSRAPDRGATGASSAKNENTTALPKRHKRREAASLVCSLLIRKNSPLPGDIISSTFLLIGSGTSTWPPQHSGAPATALRAVCGNFSNFLPLAVTFVLCLSGCFRKTTRVAEVRPTFSAVPVSQVRILNAPPSTRFEKLGFITVQQDWAKPPGNAIATVRELAAAKGATAVVFVSSNERSFRNADGRRIRDRRITYQAIHEP